MRHVVCLFEHSGLSANDWAVAGYHVFCYDKLHVAIHSRKVGLGRVTFVPWDANDCFQRAEIINRHDGRCALLLAFPPCTDLAVSGAKHFSAKAEDNPNYRAEAMQLVYAAHDIAEALSCPYAIENPVSVISSEWRKPDHIFHPYEYGGYLPEDDVHPKWPEYIRARDAYPKKTCYWTGGGFVMPTRKPVDVELGTSDQYKKLGGKSAKTKEIRSMSPRGVARAIFEANKEANCAEPPE